MTTATESRKITNAIVSVVGWTDDTSILTVTSTKEHGNQSATWCSRAELLELAELLTDAASKLVNS